MQRVRDAMRSGEWLRTQGIARVAFDLVATNWQPDHAPRVRRALNQLYDDEIERRAAEEHKRGEVGGFEVRFAIPRWEWRRPLDLRSRRRA